MSFINDQSFRRDAVCVMGWALIIGAVLGMVPFSRIAERVRLEMLAKQIAAAYGVDFGQFRKVINCESEWNPRVQSEYLLPDGTQENSWGIAQFNLDYNDMTKEQALDPEYALTKMAEHWREGRASAWRCYQLYDARDWR